MAWSVTDLHITQAGLPYPELQWGALSMLLQVPQRSKPPLSMGRLTPTRPRCLAFMLLEACLYDYGCRCLAGPGVGRDLLCTDGAPLLAACQHC